MLDSTKTLVSYINIAGDGTETVEGPFNLNIDDKTIKPTPRKATIVEDAIMRGSSSDEPSVVQYSGPVEAGKLEFECALGSVEEASKLMSASKQNTTLEIDNQIVTLFFKKESTDTLPRFIVEDISLISVLRNKYMLFKVNLRESV